jgi:hypothetical protein
MAIDRDKFFAGVVSGGPLTGRLKATQLKATAQPRTGSKRAASSTGSIVPTRSRPTASNSTPTSRTRPRERSAPATKDWIEAAKTEPEEVEELDVEF